jgi:hypothetical protein
MIELLVFFIKLPFVLLGAALSLVFGVIGALLSLLGGILSGLATVLVAAIVVLLILWLLAKVFEDGNTVTVRS